MAKKSKIARNEQRKVVVDRYAAKRAELKKALVSPESTDDFLPQITPPDKVLRPAIPHEPSPLVTGD